MAHILKNEHIRLHLNLPGEHYHRVRYDWTGLISRVDYRDITITGSESPHPRPSDGLGHGFCNEFGIKTPVGYDEIPPGGWFHKIGVGLLQRDEQPYDFLKDYPNRPAAFSVEASEDYLRITSRGEIENGYGYELTKEIRLLESGFEIRYMLTNTGSKQLITTEYNHNFLALGDAVVGEDYQLSYPFALRESVLDENINPENLVVFHDQHVSFASSPSLPFFFSDLSGGQAVPATWTLAHKTKGIFISETGDFSTTAVHLWGARHVISPELYIRLNIAPGQTKAWTRTYHISIR